MVARNVYDLRAAGAASHTPVHPQIQALRILVRIRATPLTPMAGDDVDTTLVKDSDFPASTFHGDSAWPSGAGAELVANI